MLITFFLDCGTWCIQREETPQPLKPVCKRRKFYPIFDSDHPEWRYPIGRKAWLKIKRHRNRCKELFIAGCHYAHWKAEKCKTLDALKELVLTNLLAKNTPRLRNYEYPLAESDVEKIAKDLAESAWNWKNKKISEGTQRKINFGAMRLPKMSDLGPHAYTEETRKRQQLSAIRTHGLRRFKTKEKIMCAIMKCELENIKVTKTLIANRVGIRREELSRRYKDCFEHKSTLCIHQTTQREIAGQRQIADDEKTAMQQLATVGEHTI